MTKLATPAPAKKHQVTPTPPHTGMMPRTPQKLGNAYGTGLRDQKWSRSFKVEVEKLHKKVFLEASSARI